MNYKKTIVALGHKNCQVRRAFIGKMEGTKLYLRLRTQESITIELSFKLWQ